MLFYYILLYNSFMQVEMADTFRSEGKIYTVIVIVLLILIGIFFYLYRIERKIDKIEKNK